MSKLRDADEKGSGGRWDKCQRNEIGDVTGYCYKQGNFTGECTVEEMREICKGKLKGMGFPGFLTGLMTSNLPKLERWRK